MSVLVILTVPVDPERFKQVATDNADTINAIAERGKQAGATRHHFWAGEGEMLVVDEWDSAESFQGFFDSEQDIPRLMADAGIQGAPQARFYNLIETSDSF